MFRTPLFPLTLAILSLSGSQSSTLELQTIVTQLVVKENSPLCLSLDYYELDQVVIIQQHVDTLSIQVHQVYVRFTVVASCKAGGPQSCEDQMRLCNSQFALNGSDVNDDITMCDALPDIQFGEPEEKPSREKKAGVQKAADTTANEHEKKEIGYSGNEKPRKVQKVTGELNPNERNVVMTENKEPNKDTIENKREEVAKDEESSKKVKEVGKDEKSSKKLKEVGKGVIGYHRKDAKHSKEEDVSFNSIELLLFIQNAVDAVNDASNGKLQLTLSKISSIQQSDPSGTYSFVVTCNQPSEDTQKCNISVKSKPGLKEQAILVDYACKPITTAAAKKTPSPKKAPASTANKNRPVDEPKNLPALNKKPSQVTLIAEYAAIQMDIIDADDYRRVVLQVTSVRESLTTDGNSVLYSLSVIMVSTSCTEIKHISDDSQSCLDQMLPPAQQCTIDCSRSCSSDEPPTLVSSQCDPISEDASKDCQSF